MKLTLGTFSPFTESLDNEFKSVHLLPMSLSQFSQSDIFNLVKVGKWTDDFNITVQNNLLQFIYKILPKYIACWANSNLNGNLFFGFDDNRIISGIPTLNEIPRNEIEDTIKKTILDNIDTELNKHLLMDMIDIQYFPLTIDKDIISDTAQVYYDKFSQETREYYLKLEQFNIQHELFLMRHRQCTQSLIKILNNDIYRKDLKHFIIQHSDNQCPDKILKLLDSNEFIFLEDDNVLKDRENPNRIFYWAARFRSYYKKINAKTKPEKPFPPSIYHPKQILANLPLMKAKFVQANTKIQYYIIKITCRVGQIKSDVYFRDQSNNKMIYRKRIFTDGPGCI
jgi:hypothetical protein